MKISYSWLKDFLPIEEDPTVIAKFLTQAGLEVDSIDTFIPPFSGVVVAEIRQVEKHPNAERLSVVKVFDGQEELQIVCAATNCRAGMKTALARIGAVLKDAKGESFIIKKSKLRDVESLGMLCALDELGLEENSEGIVDLKEEFAIGANLAKLFEDSIFEISLTPNLGHCMSVLGVARELAAQMGKKVVMPAIYDASQALIVNPFKVTIDSKEASPQYACKVASSIEWTQTPLWMKRRLLASGLRSIDVLVDISNYVMLELGQPLHFFDKDKLYGNYLKVALAKEEKNIELLNDKIVVLPQGCILIEDEKGPVAIAGVMGGKTAAVTSHTKSIVMESAEFNPTLIRKTARSLDLRSDSSQRFEKGIDPNGLERALQRASYLLHILCKAQISETVRMQNAPVKAYKEITCRTKRINNLLGTSLSTNEILEMLSLLDMKAEQIKEDSFTLLVPSYRNDISQEIDIVEEVARMYGLDNLHKTPLYSSSSLPDNSAYIVEKKIRSYLFQSGLQEFITCDLISPELVKLTEEITLAKACEISVMQPSSIEQSVLRTSLLQGLLLSVKNNLNQKIADIHAFEVGKVHYRIEGGFHEHFAAGVVLSGNKTPYHFDPKPQEVDFFDLKGIIENLLDSLHAEGVHFEASHLKTFHPSRQARIKKSEAVLGVIGEVHPSKLKALGIDRKVYYSELNLAELAKELARLHSLKPLPVYPGSDRDWTIIVEDKITISEINAAIASIPSRILFKVNLMDIYKNKNLGDHRKSVTFRLQYLDAEKTLSNDEVEKEHERITQEVAKNFAVSI